VILGWRRVVKVHGRSTGSRAHLLSFSIAPCSRPNARGLSPLFFIPPAPSQTLRLRAHLSTRQTPPFNWLSSALVCSCALPPWSPISCACVSGLSGVVLSRTPLLATVRIFTHTPRPSIPCILTVVSHSVPSLSPGSFQTPR